METTLLKPDTRLIHAGEPEPLIMGAVSMPVFQSSTYAYEGQDDYNSLKYIRLNNTPNHNALHQKLAAVEGGDSAIVTASGMAAISTALMALLQQGDHFLAQDCLYGGTHEFITVDAPEMGVQADFINGNDPESWEQKIKPETKLIYVETITNPLIQIPDLEKVVEFAGRHGILSLIDNTFASPVNYRPLEHGFDLSLHSCTKYLNGHSDIVAGAVIGKKALIEQITHKLNRLGGTLDPHACFLLHRGMKTLGVRVRRQNQSALTIAAFLENHPAIENVNYPGLASHPQYQRAGELFEGYGGMLSFKIRGDVDQAETFIQRTEIPICAPSLGGVETLITRPATTSHSGVPREERIKMGISDNLIRLSVGLEDPEDIIDDFRRALNP